jgi:hypothetical protein
MHKFFTGSLERPKNVTKEFYTKQEAAELEKRAAQEETEQNSAGHYRRRAL